MSFIDSSIFRIRNIKNLLIIMAVIIGALLLAACSNSSQANDTPVAYETSTGEAESIDSTKKTEIDEIEEQPSDLSAQTNVETKMAADTSVKDKPTVAFEPSAAEKPEQKPETPAKNTEEQGQTAQNTPPAPTDKPASQTSANEPKPSTEKTAKTPDADTKTEEETEPQNTQFNTEPVPAGKPQPIEPQDIDIGNAEYTCTLSVRCDTILDNMSNLDKNKTSLVPSDGVIFPETSVTFYEGESVFNVLQREMKKAKIHMEFRNTPMYNSAYVMGINNLYEFDCGELSGWMYKVNGWFPNYGCSRYQLKDGDKIEWLYTCDLGRDLGEHWLGGATE